MSTTFDYKIAIEDMIQNIERQEELVEGLEALRTIAVRINTPSVTDVALFRVAANMAVSGTEDSAEEFIPAIEADKPINTKAFDEKIKDIKKKIASLQADLVALQSKKKLA